MEHPILMTTLKSLDLTCESQADIDELLEILKLTNIQTLKFSVDDEFDQSPILHALSTSCHSMTEIAVYDLYVKHAKLLEYVKQLSPAHRQEIKWKTVRDAQGYNNSKKFKPYLPSIEISQSADELTDSGSDSESDYESDCGSDPESERE